MSTPTTPDPAPVHEEYFGNQATDVEVEDDAPSNTHNDPWDPEQIRIHTRHFSLRQIIDMIGDKDIDLAPDFQRQYVWKGPQRWGLIESIMLGIPLPSFYFNEDKTGKLQVVDGVQRLTTIKLFVENKFKLDEMAYLKGLETQTYQAVDGVYRRRFQQTQIVAHVIDPQTPYRLKFDVFKRINTGGTPLSAQEIRHCMSLERSRTFLRALVELPEFKRVMGAAVIKHPRMADREIALRLVAFHIIPWEEYAGHDSLDEFLGKVTEQIDVSLSATELDRVASLAKNALINAESVFGEHAFRKWAFNTDYKNPINRTLVESWGAALAHCDPAEVVSHAMELRAEARRMMSEDGTFIDSINGSTGDPRKVRTRMKRVAEAVARLLA